MTISYEYSVQNDFPNHKVGASKLTAAITESAITIACEGVTVSNGICRIDFKTEISESEEIILDTIVSEHDGDDTQYLKNPIANDGTQYVRVTEKTVGKMMQLKGFEIPIIGNDTTDYYMKWTENIEFVGARAKIYNATTGDEYADFNDKVQMQVVDKDNILGYGAGLIITEFGKDVPGKILEWGCVSETTTATTLMTGLYIKISYLNTTNIDKKLSGLIKYYH